MLSVLYIFIFFLEVEVFQLGDSLAYDVLRSRHERIKRQAAKRNKNPLLEPVQPNQKRMISVDPASFSCKLVMVLVN